jgi:hypothetical protein
MLLREAFIKAKHAQAAGTRTGATAESDFRARINPPPCRI